MSSEIYGYEQLDVWKLSHELVLKIYSLTNTLPKEENYILRQQILRSVISVPANIAEGNGRKGKADYAHFLSIARGSLNETEYFIRLSKDLLYIDNDNFLKLKDDCQRIRQMINKLIAKLQ